MKSIEQLKKKDLNCNIFSVYDYDGLTITELLCQFFTKINECIDISNETIDLAKWLVNEGLEIEVAKKLVMWLEDGTLENIINVNLFKTLNEKINGLSSQLEHIEKYKLDIVTPKMFEGSDINKVQLAINLAVETGKKLILDRVYDITGGQLKINKGETGQLAKRYPTYIEGGGLKKLDAGFIFTSDLVSTSDIYINNVFFESQSGVGCKVYDLDKLIRIHSTNCQYSKIDTIAITSSVDGYSQSCRFIGDTITSGVGYAFVFNGVYDTVIDNVLIEQRDSGILFNSSGYHGASYGLTITNSAIEGLTGTAIRLKGSLNTKISNCYFEGNKVGHIVIEEGSYNEVLTIENCGLYGSVTNKCDTLIKANGKFTQTRVENCRAVYGMVIDCTGVTQGQIFYKLNKSYLKEKAIDKLIIEELQRFDTIGNDVKVSYFGTIRRLYKKIDFVTLQGMNKIVVDFGVKLNLDDIISVQVYDDRIEGLSFYRSGNTVVINAKSPSAISTIPYFVTVLQPTFSITG